MATFAAVDIGANSVRLKIAALVNHRLSVVHEDREVTRLGESVFRFRMLDPAAMAHTVKVLSRFHKEVQDFGAETVRVVATSPLRDANNAAAFKAWVHAATGWQVEIITGLEEGRLIHLGVVSGSRLPPGRMLLIDLGGGSCELITSLRGQIEKIYSLPLGAVRLTRKLLAARSCQETRAAAVESVYRGGGRAGRTRTHGIARATERGRHRARPRHWPTCGQHVQAATATPFREKD